MNLLPLLLRKHYRQLLSLAVMFAGVLGPLVLFGKVADEISEEGFLWDDAILLWLHAHATPALDRFFIIVTQSAGTRVMVPFILAATLLLWWYGGWERTAFFFTATVGAGALNLLAKLFFARARPTLWEWLVSENSFSFPSGHAMISMAVAAALVFLGWPTRGRWPILIAGAAFVLLIGLSRLYLGVHYPSDILAGWCASLGWIAAVASTLHIHQRGYWQRGRTWLATWRDWRRPE